MGTIQRRLETLPADSARGVLSKQKSADGVITPSESKT